MFEPIIDYMSISVPTKKLWTQFHSHIADGDQFTPDKRTRKLLNLLLSSRHFIESEMRGIWNKHIQFHDLGINYFEGEINNVSLIQISGEGCRNLEAQGYLINVLSDWHDRFTRYDIAVDIACDTNPEVFARSRSNNRFKSGGHIRSSRGETWYVGGKHSDRHARVYRYNDHPTRPDYLRIEYELHDGEAIAAAKGSLELGVPEMGLRLGATFGWTHPSYNSPSDVEKTKSVPREPGAGKTEHWIHKSVKPAIEKLAKNGKIQFLIAFESWLHAIIEEYSPNERTS